MIRDIKKYRGYEKENCFLFTCMKVNKNYSKI